MKVVVILNQQETRKQQLKQIVGRAIQFLRPYLGVSRDNEYWLKRKFDRLVIEFGRPRYGYDKMILPEDINEGDSLIGHETGHWFHEFRNSTSFATVARMRRNCPLETFADYVEAVYVTKGEAEKELRNHRSFLYSLPHRSFINWDEKEELCLAHRAVQRILREVDL